MYIDRQMQVLVGLKYQQLDQYTLQGCASLRVLIQYFQLVAVPHLVMTVDIAGILLILQLTYMLIFMMKISDGLEDGPKKPVLSLLEEFGSGKISV